MLSLSDFDYPLPKELIAQEPLPCRDSSRLLVVERKSGNIFHRQFPSIIEYLNKNDCLVLNDTRVVPARLFCRKKKTEGKVELLLLERLDKFYYRALTKPKLNYGDELLFNGKSLSCKVADRTSISSLKLTSERWDEILSLGEVPLPPYIKRKPTEFDRNRYQTVYAKKPGAVAAPTAGLHFTEEVLKALKAKGVRITFLTLHIGYGTFKPVRCETIENHRVEREYFEISEDAIRTILETKNEGGRVVAVGTTTCRALETITQIITDGKSQMSTDYRGYTDLFIYPPYKFRVVDALLTNFHLPKTTLLLLVSAFAGHKLIFETYRQAIEHRYRFYSYGDAMLIT